MPQSFGDLSREMSEARESLRSFTLGRRGFSQRDGEKSISRVNDLCDQMTELFGSSGHATEVAATVKMARNQIQAAKARLVILRRGPVH